MYYKLASLISAPTQKTETTSEVFISQPDYNKENLAGRLFVVAEINSNKATALKIINFLIDILNHNYYQNEKIILREKLSTLKIEHIFEAALAKTNKNLMEFLRTEKIKIAPSALNIIAGVIYENELHFSIAGKNKALLVYKEKEGEKKPSPKRKAESMPEISKYKITDIGKNDYENKKPKELTKIFSDVISGNLPRGGYFFFTNEALPEYLTGRQIVEIITKLPPAGAAEQIKKNLEQINDYVPFAGIIIKNTQGLPQDYTAKDNEIKKDNAIEDSIETLNLTQSSTEKLLSPSGLIDFKKISGFFSACFSKIRNNSQKANDKVYILKEKIIVQKQKSPVSFQKIKNFTKNFLANMGALFIFIYKNITDKNKLKSASEKIKQTPELARKKSEEGGVWFKSLGKKNKTVLISVGIVILLFSISLFATNRMNNKKEIQEAYNTLIAEIEQKQNQIEASLLYSNEERAKKLLSENTDLLNELTQKTKDDDEKLLDFHYRHEEQLEKIRRFAVIENPKEIADFAKLNNQAKANNLIFGEGKIYSGDSGQKSIYAVDIKNGLVTAIADLGIAISKLSYPVISRDKNLYFLNNNSLVELNIATEEMKNLNLNLPGTSQDIVGIKGYNNRLYLLDSSNNQIYRISKGADGFTSRDSWLKDEADLSESTDLAIDGNIYILNKNGTVLKFLSGEEEALLMDQIEPKLLEADKIAVSNQEDGYIYILESKTNRLAVFRKNGSFVLQYRSDQLQNIKDFAINETDKKIYILNDNAVYEIDGEHF